MQVFAAVAVLAVLLGVEAAKPWSKPAGQIVLFAVSGSSTSKPAAKPVPVPAPSAPKPAPKPGCDTSGCNKYVDKYYREINCKPVAEAGVCCANQYECPPASTRAPNKCHYKGAGYDQGKSLADALTNNPCTKDCKCEKFVEVVKFQCAAEECSQDKPAGCKDIYTEGKCCPTIKCAPLVISDNKKGPTGSTAATPLRKDAVTCTFQGTTYVEGERLPVNPLQPCHTCTCQKGFNGKLEGSGCKEMSCDIELRYGVFIQRGCAPTYYGTNGCCPISWRCPSLTDTIVVADKKAPSTAAGVSKCTFGALTLEIGDKISSTNEDEDCKCLIPPHITCIHKELAYNLDIIEGQ